MKKVLICPGFENRRRFHNLFNLITPVSCLVISVVEQLKALVWFWIIDETLVLTSILSMCRLKEVGTCQVMEQEMIMMMMVMTTR